MRSAKELRRVQPELKGQDGDAGEPRPLSRATRRTSVVTPHARSRNMSRQPDLVKRSVPAGVRFGFSLTRQADISTAFSLSPVGGRWGFSLGEEEMFSNFLTEAANKSPMRMSPNKSL